VRLAVAVAVAGICAACGARSSGAVTEPVPTATPTSVAALHLPFDAYALSDAQEAVDEYLGLFLEKSCMAKLGFSFLPGLDPGYVTRDTRTFVEFDSRLWGISDPVQAGRYGYHLPPWVQGTSDSHAQSLGSLPPAEQVALLGIQLTGHPAQPGSGSASGRPSGVPVGGCRGEAQREVAAAGVGEVDQTATLVAHLRLQSFERAQADPRVRKVFAEWSTCMRASGYVYSTPFKPIFNMAAPPTALEIRTAKADVACKYKTNLLGVTYAIQADYQNALIESNAQQLAAVKAQVKGQQQALAAAEAKYGMAR
jgi:hypothetical protein